MIASYEGHSLSGSCSRRGPTGDDVDTALHVSAQEGRIAISEMLVEAGADLEAATTLGFTPLIVAATRGQSGVMTMLIEAGGDSQTGSASAVGCCK